MGKRPVKPGARLLPAVLLGVVLGALVGAALASDDWDWDAVEDIDDAPVTRAATPPPKTSSAAPRRAAVAEPDFEAAPVTALAMFDDVAPFEVVQSKRDGEMHPCANCHQWVLSNSVPRKLKTPHDNFELEHGLHGKGGFWCFTCHDVENNFSLKTLEGEAVEFGHAYIVCSQCHAQQARDWAHGAHGKRVGNWQGKRQVFNCTACHYQHGPAIEPRAPLPGPAVRVGLPRPAHWVAADQREDGHATHHRKEWERDADQRRKSREHEHGPAAAADETQVNLDAES